MKKHHHQNKYDKQRKYYDNSKQNQPKENLTLVSVPVANDVNSNQNSNSNPTQPSENSTTSTFVPQEKFLINVI
jgi:hypothetical protein